MYPPQLGDRVPSKLTTADGNTVLAGVINNKVIPFVPLEFVADFLSSLFQRGYKYRTMNNYRSAFSAFCRGGGSEHGPTDFNKACNEGSFQFYTHLPKYKETWDVCKVLTYLGSMGENLNLPLN
jgi:hypothetical protein